MILKTITNIIYQLLLLLDVFAIHQPHILKMKTEDWPFVGYYIMYETLKNLKSSNISLSVLTLKPLWYYRTN